MEKKLYRSTKDKKVCGVCAGLAKYLSMDPTIARVIWALVTVCSVGLGLLAYIACALIIPEEPEDADIVDADK